MIAINYQKSQILTHFIDIQLEFGISTLKRIKTRTKEILRQVSRHYSNVRDKLYEDHTPADNNETPSPPQIEPSTFRSELKRRLSSVSIRRSSLSIRRHNSGPKWKWPRRNSETNQLNTIPNSDNSPLKTVYNTFSHKGEHSKNQTLSELFQSADFESRLNEGSVSGRKSYQEDENVEDEYHISYRENNQLKPTCSNNGLNTFQERLVHFKEQTLQRSKSFQTLAKYFTQEL